MTEVSSEEIASYRPLVESLANRLSRMAEFDDLVQEGLINVWERLQLGTKPKGEYIRRRMLDWVRYCQRLERGDTITYEAAMQRGVVAG